MTDPNTLFRLARDMFDCTGDSKQFGIKQRNFTTAYNRADYQEQGEYHHLWCAWLKGRVLISEAGFAWEARA